MSDILRELRQARRRRRNNKLIPVNVPRKELGTPDSYRISRSYVSKEKITTLKGEIQSLEEMHLIEDIDSDEIILFGMLPLHILRPRKT